MKNTRLSSVLVLCVFILQSGVAIGDEHANLKDSDVFKEAVYFLETWIDSVIDFDRLPGVSIAIVHDQDLIYAKGFGYADIKTGLRATPDTFYSICSISKLFTAISLMQLRDAGKLSLDDPVSNYLPWFDPELVNPNEPPPTLGDLLRHSGGLPCEPDFEIWASPEDLYPLREEFIRRVSHLKMSYPTNTQFNYSNVGYALLGEVVSVVSNMDYVDYVQQKILSPLKLEQTFPYVSEESQVKQTATGYGRWPREGSRVEFPHIDLFERTMLPAGGFGSTVKDLAKFAMWQFRVLDGTDANVLKRETLEEMQTLQWPQPKWGYGFAIWQIEGKSLVGHQGGCPGYKSQIIVSPEDKIAVVVLVNSTDAPQFTLALASYNIMASAITNKQDDESENKKGEWEKYVGYYTADRSWAEAEVLYWRGSLSVMWLPSQNPLGSLVKLRHIEGGVFREIKRDGSLGKHYVFGLDPGGHISLKFNNNILNKTPR